MPGYEEEDDLFAAARSAPEGDLRAFEELVERNQRRIVADCRHITHDESIAEDLAQEVFVKAYFARHSFEGRSSFRHWLQKIKVNHCINHRKKQQGRVVVSMDDEEAGPNAAEMAAISSHDRHAERLGEQQIIHRILDAMPDSLRIPLVMRDMDEMSYQEVAEKLNLGLSATKMRINRAREWFRAQYEAYAPRQEASQ